MVQRSSAKKRDEKANVRKASRSLKKKSGSDMQQPGKLMLNNPLIPAELDEDIDDDLAFNSEDERLYGDFFANKTEKKVKTKSKKETSKPDLGNSSDEDDYVTDGLAVLSKADEKKKTKKTSKQRKSTKESEDLYNYHEDGQSSGDDEDYIDLSDMLDMSLKNDAKEGKKKKTKKTSAASKVSKKRRTAQVTEESESIYGLAEAGADGGAASFNEAMRKFVRQKNETTQQVSSVRDRIAQSLQSRHNLVSVDTDDVTKDRMTRKEVRAIVSENMSRYKPLLRELETSKHLQFPMQAPDSVPVPSSVGGIVAAVDAKLQADGAVRGALANTSAYRLGTKMDDILSKAGLSRRQVSAEADTPNSIGSYVRFDNEESAMINGGSGGGRGEGDDRDGAPTTSYMAKLKAMLAYENSRRKRFNRIKSKTYRRILRKEKDREKEQRDKAFELLHPELARKRLAERLLKARIEERVTQKHRNTSAWVKRAKRFAEFDANAKDAVNEQLAIHQKLVRKMDQDAGEEDYERYGGGDAASEASSEEERVVDELVAKISASKGAPLDKKELTSILWRQAGRMDDDDEEGTGGTSQITKARAELREMKFMKNAREREDKQYQEQMDDLRRDIEAYQNGEGGDSDSDGSEEVTDKIKKTDRDSQRTAYSTSSKIPGRLSFKKTEGSKIEKTGPIRLPKQRGIIAGSFAVMPEAGEEESDLENTLIPTSSISVTSNDEDDADAEQEVKDTTAAPLRKEKAATKVSASKKKEVMTVSEFAGDRKRAGSSGGATPVPKSTSTRVRVLPQKRLREEEEEEEAKTSTVKDPSGETSDDLQLHQEYLISRAFAHDDVDEDFVKEKESQVETIMRPEDKNQSLPGWGEWGGEDPELNKHHQEVVQHNTIQRQIERSFLLKSRADAALDHVIINHDGVELVPDRMTLHMVPRPFSNPQEFARSMRQPIGPEWTSALSFKEGVQPRVEVRQGHSVLPLDLSLRKKTSKTKRRKADTSTPTAS